MLKSNWYPLLGMVMLGCITYHFGGCGEAFQRKVSPAVEKSIVNDFAEKNPDIPGIIIAGFTNDAITPGVVSRTGENTRETISHVSYSIESYRKNMNYHVPQSTMTLDKRFTIDGCANLKGNH